MIGVAVAMVHIPEHFPHFCILILTGHCSAGFEITQGIGKAEHKILLQHIGYAVFYIAIPYGTVDTFVLI
jgi:hypothetical protein